MNIFQVKLNPKEKFGLGICLGFALNEDSHFT